MYHQSYQHAHVEAQTRVCQRRCKHQSTSSLRARLWPAAPISAKSNLIHLQEEAKSAGQPADSMLRAQRIQDMLSPDLCHPKLEGQKKPSEVDEILLGTAVPHHQKLVDEEKPGMLDKILFGAADPWSKMPGAAVPHLSRLFRDECNDLVMLMRKQAPAILDLRHQAGTAFENICSEMVVKAVEAHNLGCCASTCGWNGRTCAGSATGNACISLGGSVICTRQFAGGLDKIPPR